MDEVKVSKFISFVLRHCPDAIDAEIDKKGWMDTDTLIAGVSKKYSGFNLDTLVHIVETDSKGRYQFNDSKTKIRAVQGHSVNGIDADLKEIIPQDILYHGTSYNRVHSIMTQGILRMSRTHVHLSKDIDTANKVGSRHGVPVVLQIDAKRMHEDGIVFYESNNGVVLTKYVDPKYIKEDNK